MELEVEYPLPANKRYPQEDVVVFINDEYDFCIETEDNHFRTQEVRLSRAQVQAIRPLLSKYLQQSKQFEDENSEED